MDNETKNGKQIMVEATHEEFFYSPLPRPDHMAEYTQLYPDAANFFFTQMRKEQEERQKRHKELIEISKVKVEISKAAQKSRNREAMVGQIFGFLLGIAGILSSTYLVCMNYQWSGLGIGLATLGTISIAHIKGRNKDK